jgi:hypothetical protein
MLSHIEKFSLPLSSIHPIRAIYCGPLRLDGPYDLVRSRTALYPVLVPLQPLAWS